jgi:2-desacetyl-2-hydroxyethyl bacteriochlorophyllide A dehydrogenase
MNALVYLGPHRMQLQTMADPVPDAGEVVIRTSASAICGSDLHGFREASPRRIPPLVMGHEAIGEVVAVGPDVPAGRVGERVVLKPVLACGRCRRCAEGRTNLCAEGRLVGRDLPGGFAELLAVPAGAAVAIPAGIGDDQAVLTEPLANAVHVARGAVTKGDVALVIGSGPIGVLMAKAALLDGADRVLVTDPARDRLRFATGQGAEAVVGDPVEAVLAATDGEGADLVIDAAGFEATWALGLRAIRPGGRIVEVGLGAGSGVLDFFGVLGKEATITGSYAWTDDDFARSIELLAGGALRTDGWITTMPLAKGQRAFEELTGGGDAFKVVLVP